MNKFTFKEYNANPKKRNALDCVIRAISVANNKTWEDTALGLTQVMIDTGYVINEKRCYEKYLKNHGYIKQKMPKRVDNTKYTVEEFVKHIAEPNKTYVLSLRHHLTLVKNLELIDTWNCKDYKVGNYYEK